MIRRYLSITLIIFSVTYSGEISVSISENLVNDYLKLIGDHQIPKGKPNNQALWSIKNPRVKFLEVSAEFRALVNYKKGKTNIKKHVNLRLFELIERLNAILNLSYFTNML